MLLLLTGRLIGYAQEGVFEVQLTIHDSTWLFQLQEHDIRTSDFRVELETSAGRRVFQKGLCNTYKGVVNNDTLQKARFYISDNYLGGNFESGGEMYFITPARFLLEPEEGQNLSLTYVLHKEKLICGPSTNGFTQWAEESKQLLVNYLNGFNPIYNWDNDACLQYAPPVDYDFQMILEGNEVLYGDFGNVCVEEEIDATFYNEFDDYDNLTWQYSYNLFQLAAPAQNERTFQAISAGPAYVSITFEYQGQTLTYTRTFQVGTPTEPVGPPGIIQVPGASPTQYDIIYYGVPFADYYRYQITLVGPLGNPISQETGTTDDLFPLITIPDDVCAQITIRPGNECGLSAQAYYFEACPPFGPNLRRQTSDNIEGVTTKEKENIDGLKLFPNPAQEEIRITSTQPLQQVQIFDAAGQKVYGYDPIGLMKFLVVTVVNWPVGLYVVKATTQTGVVSKQFLVEK